MVILQECSPDGELVNLFSPVGLSFGKPLAYSFPAEFQHRGHSPALKVPHCRDCFTKQPFSFLIEFSDTLYYIL